MVTMATNGYMFVCVCMCFDMCWCLSLMHRIHLRISGYHASGMVDS